MGEGTEDTRRRVLKQDLLTAKHDAQLIENVVQKLADEKLLVTRERAEVDVAHEALIRNWILLRQWLDECRDLLRQQRKIENAAQDWQVSGQKTDYLLSKKRLKEAKNFQKEQQEKYPLSQLAASFVAQSSKYQRRERIKSLGLFLIIPLIGTVIGGYFVVREIWLNADKKLLRECEGKEYCLGRIEALQRLVFARKNLQSYNFRGVDLRGASLYGANLEGANLYGVNLEAAFLGAANLEGANLEGANLRSANLEAAFLGAANLAGANLEFANLVEAALYLVFIYGPYRGIEIELSGANLENAKLFGASFSSIAEENPSLKFKLKIKSACNWDKAFYKGHYDNKHDEWIIDEKANQEYINQLKQDKTSDPKEPVDCSRWE